MRVRVIVVIECANKFLLVQMKGQEQTPPKWQNVEGFLQPTESLEIAAQRIVREALQLSISSPRFIMSNGSKISPDELAVVMFTAIEGQPPDHAIKTMDSIQNHGWFTLAQAGAVDLVQPGSTLGTFAQLQRAVQE